MAQLELDGDKLMALLRGRDPFVYLAETASKNPAAVALAKSVNVDITKLVPRPHGPKGGTMFYVHRLVETGLDTPDNLQLLFGEAHMPKVKEMQRECRLNVLFQAPQGSPMHAMLSSMSEGAPSDRRPRPPTAEEEAELARYREVTSRLQGIFSGPP